MMWPGNWPDSILKNVLLNASNCTSQMVICKSIFFTYVTSQCDYECQLGSQWKMAGEYNQRFGNNNSSSLVIRGYISIMLPIRQTQFTYRLTVALLHLSNGSVIDADLPILTLRDPVYSGNRKFRGFVLNYFPSNTKAYKLPQLPNLFPDTSKTCSSVACESSAGMRIRRLSLTHSTFRLLQPPICEKNKTAHINEHVKCNSCRGQSTLMGGGQGA